MSISSNLVIPLDSKPIKIGPEAFYRCISLANIVLPQRSIAGFMSAPDYRKRDTFDSCTLLQDRFGNGMGYVVDGLVARFDGFPVHKLCYDHSSVTATELGHCIIEDQGEESPLVDQFGMTPFHVLFSTHEPRQDLLQALLDNYYPYHTGILDCKDANGKRPLDYLLSNWTGISMSLFRISLQKWMVDSMVRWGATSWRNDMQTKVQAILAEGDMVQKANLCNEAYGSLEGYEGMGAMYILEIALWKRKLKDGRSKDGTKRQALDREECRCVCGSNIVVPSVKLFLEIDRNHPDRADSSPHD
ncbi:unnamed protein product [Cylindrotheca closterium]|uniref:Uncharacterized protein n=1 Tax=Cylindrotheca closterium TaxID=2856 RepID=A0AAD2CSQ2_9STRA|nr:unnamed protein product [Cylindrotheca closterium]